LRRGSHREVFALPFIWYSHYKPYSGLSMSIDTEVQSYPQHGVMGGREAWEPYEPVEYALRILNLIDVMKRIDREIYITMGFNRELRMYISRWISSLRHFKYDPAFSESLMISGIPSDIMSKAIDSIEDLIISTSIILSEDKITLSDTMEYLELVSRILSIKSQGDPIWRIIYSGGRLREIASRVALLILYIISLYIAIDVSEPE